MPQVAGSILAAGSQQPVADAPVTAQAVTAIPPSFFTVVDSGGPNDVNSEQNDLTQMGRDDTNPSYYDLFWSWDTTNFTAQKGNACALFDTDNDATVTINDIPSAIELLKTADPETVNEPGGDVTFSFVVNNLSTVDTVNITSLSDNVYGDLTAAAGSTCTVPQSIAPKGSYSCKITAFVGGNAGASHYNKATASGVDDDGGPVTASDNETVTITDVASSIRVTKSANPSSVPETGGDVLFTVVVENTSPVDNVTINSVVDSVFGDVSGSCTPALPANLAPGQKVTCTFTKFISGEAGKSHVDVATGSGVLTEPNPAASFHPIIVDLGAGCARHSSAFAINAAGVVAGDCDYHAALWQNNAWTELGALSGGYGTATALNDAGLVAGNSRIVNTAWPGGVYHAVVWNNGVISDLGDLGGGFSNAWGINDLGQVVGDSYPPDGPLQAFFWEKGLMRKLPTLGGPPGEDYCRARAINAGGLVVGDCYSPAGPHAVLWDLWDNTSLFLPEIKLRAR